MKEESFKKRKTHQLRLTKYELLHLRDLFGIVLPHNVGKTLSQALAELEDRPIVEAKLWSKISALCEECDVPLGDDAPDYVVAPAGPPPISVFQITSDPDEETEDGDFDEEDEED